ncbi:MAG: hypothetical protein RIR18_1205 [Pseudomonadota bacterium]|jgi:hypothetical protein
MGRFSNYWTVALLTSPNHQASFLTISAIFLLSTGSAQAELSAEHKHRVRGEMREIWSKMTPDERESLRRESVVSGFDGEPSGSDAPKKLAIPIRASTEHQRQLTTEDHNHLRRQLKDISADVKPSP